MSKVWSYLPGASSALYGAMPLTILFMNKSPLQIKEGITAYAKFGQNK
jgi:hypothetical protein